MSRRCDVCGKGANTANNVSHAHNVTKKKQYPNLQVVHVHAGGGRKRVKACTRCIKSGKIYAAAQ